MVRKKCCEPFAVRFRPVLNAVTISKQLGDIVEEFKDLFLDELPDQLPPWRDVNLDIKLKSDQPPTVRPQIRLSPEELQELKIELQMLFGKGLLRSSSSPYGAPIFFVRKKDSELRMVCDYWALNKITIPDSNPIPLINEALDQASGANVFSQINFIGAYHQMRIREEDCHKTAIRTGFGSFESPVLCFGLTNALASFTRLFSTLLQELNGNCLVVSRRCAGLQQIRARKPRAFARLFEILRKHNLYAKRSKCNIGAEKVNFLGFRISSEGVSMQERLYNAILDSPIPRNANDVQSFVGLANFYCRFIE